MAVLALRWSRVGRKGGIMEETRWTRCQSRLRVQLATRSRRPAQTVLVVALWRERRPGGRCPRAWMAVRLRCAGCGGARPWRRAPALDEGRNFHGGRSGSGSYGGSRDGRGTRCADLSTRTVMGSIGDTCARFGQKLGGRGGWHAGGVDENPTVDVMVAPKAAGSQHWAAVSHTRMCDPRSWSKRADLTPDR
ncbi:putative serine/arginine repetitive matrix protein 1-like [Iris pallida]|uniref:Serine/arginine repetitive matrix protein 1-like n=1 Tax=Iris pallida TaxID=29817 RepID=A0AAX6EB99_IRIPA|nr:putative serine/arginine repetitive matrix protein 1-like [Iris pallida]